MPSDKCNSITAKTTGSISSLFDVASSRQVPFHQPQYNACIMDLPLSFFEYSRDITLLIVLL